MTSIKNQGFSLVEILVVIPIIFIVIISISALIKISDTEIKRADTITLAIAIETQIVSELQNPFFLEPFRDNLKTNSNLNEIEIKYKDQLIAKVGNKIGIDKYGNTCVLASGNCILETDVDVKCEGADQNKRQCRAAYRVKLTDSSKVVMAPFGTLNADAFENGDYRTPIVFDSYLQTLIGQCPTGQIMTGFNKFTGAVFCITKPSVSSCTGDEIFRGFKFVGGNIEADCRAAPKFSCRPPYAVSSITLYGDRVDGTCTFPTVDSGAMRRPWPGGSDTVHKACPSRYYTAIPIGACTVTSIINWRGSCRCDPDDDRCIPRPMPSAPVAVGSLDGDGVTMRCRVIDGSGPCGARSTGVTSWNATCLLKADYPSTL